MLLTKETFYTVKTAALTDTNYHQIACIYVFVKKLQMLIYFYYIL